MSSLQDPALTHDDRLSPRFISAVNTRLAWGRASALLTAARAGVKARPTWSLMWGKALALLTAARAGLKGRATSRAGLKACPTLMTVLALLLAGGFVLTVAARGVDDTAATAGDWPMWRHDAGRSAGTPDRMPATLHLQWTRELPALKPAWPDQPKPQMDAVYQPIVLGKRLIIGSSHDDCVTAYDLKFLLAVLNWATVAGDGEGGVLLERNPLKGLPSRARIHRGASWWCQRNTTRFGRSRQAFTQILSAC